MSEACFKVPYGSRRQATEAKVRMSKRMHGRGNPQLQAYRCPFHDDDPAEVWHLATNSKIKDFKKAKKRQES